MRVSTSAFRSTRGGGDPGGVPRGLHAGMLGSGATVGGRFWVPARDCLRFMVPHPNSGCRTALSSGAQPDFRRGEMRYAWTPRRMRARDKLLAAVGRSRLSERKLSTLATGSTDTIRNIRRGAVPRVDTFEALCQVLGLELQLGPALSGPDDEDALRHRSPPRFSGSRELPVYEWSNRSEEGYLRGIHLAGSRC